MSSELAASHVFAPEYSRIPLQEGGHRSSRRAPGRNMIQQCRISPEDFSVCGQLFHARVLEMIPSGIKAPRQFFAPGLLRSGRTSMGSTLFLATPTRSFCLTLTGSLLIECVSKNGIAFQKDTTKHRTVLCNNFHFHNPPRRTRRPFAD